MAMLADSVEVARRRRHPQAHPHRGGGRRGHRRRGQSGHRAGHLVWLPTAAGVRYPSAWPAGLGDRGNRWLRGRADPLPPWSDRAGGGAGPPQAGRPPPRRQVRPAGRDPGRPRGAGPRPAGPATSGRTAGGVVGAAGRSPLSGPGRRRRPTPTARAGGRRTRGLAGTAPDPLDPPAGGCLRPLRVQISWDVETATTAATLRTLARRSRELTAETADHRQAILALVRAWRPDLLASRGRSDRGRHRAVRLVPCWPLPLGCRLRLARRGRPDPGLQRPDRQGSTESLRGPPANQALYTVVLTRLRTEPATRAYAQRRRARGKTNREIKRCLVRYVARQLYRLLETEPALDAT